MQPSSVAACRRVELLCTQQVRQGLSHEWGVTSGTLLYTPPLLAQCVSYFSFLQCPISSCCLLTQHMCLPTDSRAASASFYELGKHPNFCKLIFTCSFSVVACYFSLGFSDTTGFFLCRSPGPWASSHAFCFVLHKHFPSWDKAFLHLLQHQQSISKS